MTIGKPAQYDQSQRLEEDGHNLATSEDDGKNSIAQSLG